MDTSKQPHHHTHDLKQTLPFDYIPLVFRYCMTSLSPTLQALYDVIPCHYISLSS